MVNGRPRKTQEELDAEMEDYWGAANAGNGEVALKGAVSSATAVPPVIAADDDIDMIE